MKPPRIGNNFKLISEFRIKSCGMDPPPRIGKKFKFISEFRIKSCGMDPLDLTSGGNLWNSTFACTIQWCMQICHKHFPISWGPFQMLIYYFFLLQMQIWNGCNALNIAEDPMKDINVNLSFLSSGSKVVELTPPGWYIYFVPVECSVGKFVFLKGPFSVPPSL